MRIIEHVKQALRISLLLLISTFLFLACEKIPTKKRKKKEIKAERYVL